MLRDINVMDNNYKFACFHIFYCYDILHGVNITSTVILNVASIVLQMGQDIFTEIATYSNELSLVRKSFVHQSL